MKARSVVVFLLLLAIGTLTERSFAKDRLIIGYTAITGIKAGLWVAEDAGIFDKHNIQAELLLITSASKMVQAMLGGDVPFAAAGGNAAVDANLSGADMVMLGVLAKVPAFYIMALPEIKTIEDLRGKPVGVTRFGSSTDFTMRYLIAQAWHESGPRRDDDPGRRFERGGGDAQDQGDLCRAVLKPGQSTGAGGWRALAAQYGHRRCLSSRTMP